MRLWVWGTWNFGLASMLQLIFLALLPCAAAYLGFDELNASGTSTSFAWAEGGQHISLHYDAEHPDSVHIIEFDTELGVDKA